MATSLISDSHGFIEDLKASGFSDEQAAGLTRALQRSDLNHLVTKADLKAELKDLESRLIKWIVTVVGVGVALLALLIAVLSVFLGMTATKETTPQGLVFSRV